MPYTIPKTYRDRRAYRLARNATVALWMSLPVAAFLLVFAGFSFVAWGWSGGTVRAAVVGAALLAVLLTSALHGHRRAAQLENAAELRHLAAATARPALPPPRWDHLDADVPPPPPGPFPVGGGIRPELAGPPPVGPRPAEPMPAPTQTSHVTDGDFTVYALRLPDPPP